MIAGAQEIYTDLHERDIEIHAYPRGWYYLTKHHVGFWIRHKDLGPLRELLEAMESELEDESEE